MRTIALTASVAGALIAYLVQGMVSIDMLPLFATDWLVAGPAIPCAREPALVTEPPLGEDGKLPASSETPVAPAVWDPITAGPDGGDPAGPVARVLSAPCRGVGLR